jgi:hypothetical protein
MSVETTRPKRNGMVVLLMLATLAVFARAVGFGFVNYDDPTYVFRNPRMAGGLSAANIGWAFSTFHFNNWHPLTWLTYFATSQVFGLSPGAFHGVNLVLHVANVALLYRLLLRMTGRVGCSVMVAGLFGLHPLHVESVAWISELKDVLSTFFALLALHAYVSFARRRSLTAYVAMCVWFGLGLMAKPMIVTLPAAMLLLDYWPIGRLSWRAVVEKVPLFAMSVAACAVTVKAQGLAVAHHINFGARVANAVVAFAEYVERTLVPIHLTVYYPHAAIVGGMHAGLIFVASLLLVGLSGVAIGQSSARPYLLFGWLWFLGILVPVSGLVQVGEQAMADRYTYLPLIGLFIAGVWLVGDSSLRGKTVVGFAVVAGCACATEIQMGYWKNTQTLFEHAAAVTRGNYIALDHLAVDEIERGQAAEAIPFALESIRIDPQAAGRAEEAEKQYNEAIRLNPRSAVAHRNLGFLLASQGRLDEAINHWQSSLILDPSNSQARAALSQALRQTPSTRPGTAP